MKLKYMLIFAAAGLHSVCAAVGAVAQTIVDGIEYTISSDGSYYVVSGCSADIVDAVIKSEIDGVPVTEISGGVFNGTKAPHLVSATIPGSIVTMGNSIFQNNAALETCVFLSGDKNLTMGGWTFNNATALKEIKLPKRLAAMSNNSNFNGCTNLEKVEFEGGNILLTSIPQYTFANTAVWYLDISGLENLAVFPPNAIGSKASSVTLVMSPSADFVEKQSPQHWRPAKTFVNINVTDVIYPEGTKKITRNAFNGYAKVNWLTLPESLEVIEPKAFMNCSGLDRVVVPAGVKDIGESAFGHIDSDRGVSEVILLQHGGAFPNTDGKSIIASDTKAYCYSDIENIPEEIIKVPVVSGGAYQTYISPIAVEIPKDSEASCITGINDGKVVYDFSQFRSESELPANTPVLMHRSDNNDTVLYPVMVPDNVDDPVENNLLTVPNNSFEENKKYYCLSNYGGGCAFTEVNATNPLEGRVYLALDKSKAGDTSAYIVSDSQGVTTVVQTVETFDENEAPVYSIMGVKVDSDNLLPGIYIKNGKKFIVR